jgi:hypothetical protein
MVGTVVDSVDTDGIDAQFCKFCNISFAAGLISNGVRQIGGSTRLIVNATNVETLISSKEGCRMLVVVEMENSKSTDHCP